MEKVNHPLHYGGKDNPYEAIKVIEAWDLGFNLGNVVKYISRAGKKGDNYLEDLRKAKAYIEFEISKVENCATTTEPKDITSANMYLVVCLLYMQKAMILLCTIALIIIYAYTRMVYMLKK